MCITVTLVSSLDLGPGVEVRLAKLEGLQQGALVVPVYQQPSDAPAALTFGR